MSGSIRLSPKHGVNPALMVCFACGEDSGVALLGLMKPKPTGRRGVYGDPITEADPEAPRRIRDDGLCSRCQGIVDKGGVLLIETYPQPPSRPAYEGGAGRQDTIKPEDAEALRTGRMWGITGEAFARIFHDVAPHRGVVFIGSDAAALIFGPKEEP